MKQRLAAIAEIRNGYQFPGKVQPVDIGGGMRDDLPCGAAWLIQIKDIDEMRRLDTTNLPLVRVEADVSKYEVLQGDVLFLGRGHRLFATPITQPLRDTVATGYFFILRPKSHDVLPSYLAWYMNQSPFQSALRAFIKGTQQPLVSRKDIEHLTVEIPPLKTQKTIVALEDLRVKEQQLLATLQQRRSQLIQALSIKTAQEQS